jgi:VWFA-related protein
VAQVTVPDRPGKTAFNGKPGEQAPSEVAYDATTGKVTMKLPVQDVTGAFIPNLRRSHFAVFEDGIRQNNVTVEVEHAPITVAVLVEAGGRSQQLNQAIAWDAAYAARPLLDMLGREDKLALFTYDDRLHTRLDFGSPNEQREAAFRNLTRTHMSEANFYDAAIEVLERMASVPGRKAILAITTGIDTFSNAAFEDLEKKAGQAQIPLYALGLGDLVRGRIGDLSRGPLSRVDWKQCQRQLETLAQASGGRAYVPGNVVELSTIYDDLMEHLRVRYVVTYQPSRPIETTAGPRVVEVRLMDPDTGQPLRIVDASGRAVAAQAIAQASYTPTTTMQTS